MLGIAPSTPEIPPVVLTVFNCHTSPYTKRLSLERIKVS